MATPEPTATPVAFHVQATRALRELLDGCLRGIGQVMFQEHRRSGLLFLIAVGWTSPLHGGGLVAGTLAGTLAAQAFGAERAALRAGIFGFNGGLVGVGLLCFLPATIWTWLLLLLAATAASLLTAALRRGLRHHDLPPLTAPFVVATLFALLAAAHWARWPSDPSLAAGTPDGATSAIDATGLALWGEGLLNGLAQVFFQKGLVAGALIAIGLLVASLRAGALAISGSALGMLAGAALGASKADLAAGLYGYNAALVAVALGSVFAAPGRAWLGYTGLGVLLTPLASAAVTVVLTPWGLPALTLPFVLVTWLLMLAEKGFRRS